MALTAAVRRSIDCYIELHCFLETVGALEHFDWIFAEISGGDRDSLLSVECSSTLVEGGEAGDFLNIRIASQRRVSKVSRSSWRQALVVGAKTQCCLAPQSRAMDAV